MSASSPATTPEPASAALPLPPSLPFATMTDTLLAYLDGARAGSAAGVVMVRERRGTRLAFPALARQAMRVARGLRDAGICAGDVVFVALPSREDHLAAFCGAVLIGALPCCVPAPGHDQQPALLPLHVQAAARTLAPRALIVARPLHHLLAGEGSLWGRVLALEELLCHPLLDRGAVHAARPEQIHHLQLTSGSTGQPKAAALSHRAVIANIVLTAQASGVDPTRHSGAIWLPLFHDMGLIAVLSALVHGVDIVLQPPEDFIRNPMGWLQTLALYGATTSAAPTFALAYCVRRYRSESLQGVDLSHLRALVVGAERVDVQTLQAFVRKFAPHGLRGDVLLPCYGLAELVLAATVPNGNRRGTLGRNIWRQAPLGADAQTDGVLSMGRPLPGSTLQVRDADGRVLGDGEVGQIHIASPCLMSGYHGAPDLTAAVLQDGFYATGDSGFVSDGELYVLGRIKEIIILRGRNYHPHEFEECAARHPQVDVGRVAAFGVPDRVLGSERLVLAVEPDNYHALDAVRAGVQALLRAEFGFGATEIRFVPRGRIPRTTSRKIQRSACAEQFACGALPRVSPSEQQAALPPAQMA